ncbi:MAG: DUF3298 and DUF4163 domain-containing protein [Dysgonamonadaceae bacterium]|jgi:hypothetical protein|nr:DUF3298 and DUF4163 domain-containing protein [Dysgonamonadaceae bacterium]
MKTKNDLILLFAALMAAPLFFSCKNQQQKNGIAYDSTIVVKHVPAIESSDTIFPYSDVNIRFTYPVKFRNDEDLTRLQQLFTETFFSDSLYTAYRPKEALDKFIENYTDEYRTVVTGDDGYAIKEDTPEDEISATAWFWMNCSNEILFQNDSLLSYAVRFNEYTGGAHGINGTNCYCVNLSNLTLLTEEDIFKPDYRKELPYILLRRVMAAYRVSEPDGLTEEGFYGNDIAPNGNFWLDDKGVHYAFNPYEIASPPLGVITVDVPYSELTSILKPESVVSVFLKK